MPRIFFAGDIVNTCNHSGDLCDSETLERIRSADYAIANLEAPVQCASRPVNKTGPCIQQLAATPGILAAAGFSAVSLANNHIMDFGGAALRETMRSLREAGLAFVGAGDRSADAIAPLVVDVHGVSIGILAGCESQFGVIDASTPDDSPGCAWLNDPRLFLATQRLKSVCDRVILIAHAGLEHLAIPQPEWRACYRRLCDAGADAVVGSHPHVPQGWERYGDSVIFYSLGNFYFDCLSFRDSPDRSYSVILDLDRTGPVEFETVQHRKRGTQVVATPASERIDLEQLCSLLSGDYDSRADAAALAAFRRLRPLLSRGVGRGLPTSEPWLLAKQLAKRLCLGERAQDRALVAMHLIRNESYRFAIQRALRLRSGIDR